MFLHYILYLVCFQCKDLLASNSSELVSETAEARLGQSNIFMKFKKASKKTQAKQATVFQTFITTSTLFFPSCTVFVTSTNVPRFCAVPPPGRLRTAQDIEELNESVIETNSSVNNSSDFAFRKEVVIPFELESSIETSTESVTTSHGSENISVMPTTLFINEEIIGGSLIIPETLTDSVTTILGSGNSSESSSTSGEEGILEGSLIIPEPLGMGRIQRFFKVIVKETWTSLVTAVINAGVLLTETTTTTVTTVTFVTTSVNTIRIAGTSLPPGLPEC